MRLFAALPLPETAVERLTSLRLRLSTPKDGLRWSEREQWHITLQFFGDVEGAPAECLLTELAGLNAQAPDIVLESLGLFAAKGILLVTVEPSGSLQRLQGEVVKGSARCGILPESRPFRPHITLARSKGKAGQLSLRRISLPALPAFGPPVRWRAQECLLLESVLRPQGAEYLVRSRIPLSSEAGTGDGK